MNRSDSVSRGRAPRTFQRTYLTRNGRAGPARRPEIVRPRGRFSLRLRRAANGQRPRRTRARETSGREECFFLETVAIGTDSLAREGVLFRPAVEREGHPEMSNTEMTQ